MVIIIIIPLDKNDTPKKLPAKETFFALTITSKINITAEDINEINLAFFVIFKIRGILTDILSDRINPLRRPDKFQPYSIKKKKKTMYIIATSSHSPIH